MPMLIEPRKPIVEVLPLAARPYKAYALSLLAAHIAALKPAASLDAGCGDLRNRWMFPGRYVGITHRKKPYFEGEEREAPKGVEIEVYAMRLESDFSFLGAFDLCVCTNALGSHIANCVDTVQRLSDRVRLGGAFIFDERAEMLSAYEPILAAYRSVSVVFIATPERCGRVTMGGDMWNKLVREETMAPNVLGAHTRFYVLASDKMVEPTPAGARPSIVYDYSLAVVENDIPFLAS